MPDSSVCLNSRTSLADIRSTQVDFVAALDDAVNSQLPADIELANSLKRLLAIKMRNLYETLPTGETELRLNLQEQYASQLNLLKSAGFITEGSARDYADRQFTGDYITGIDGRNYPVPSYEVILAEMVKQYQALKIRTDQCFTKLVLVPFALSLATFTEKTGNWLLNYQATYNANLKPGQSPLEIDASSPISFSGWERAFKKDYASDDVYYDSPTFDMMMNTSINKRTQLGEQAAYDEPGVGWRILLVPTNPDSPATIRSIKSSNETPNKHLAELLKAKTVNSVLSNEYSLTPEEWLCLFITNLEQSSLFLDTYDLNAGDYCLAGTKAVLAGVHSYERSMAIVPTVCWHKMAGQIEFSTLNASDCDGMSAARTVVRLNP